MAAEGSLGGCLFLKIFLDMMFCMRTKFLQEINDSINKFGKYGVADELGKKITTIVKLLLIVYAKLADIHDLPYKAKLNVFEVFASAPWIS